MRRILLALCILVLLPMMAHAYTVVLKDGRRIEVQNQYRIVNEIAVFTLPDGTRFSISLHKINIADTELANGDEPGMFAKNVTNPPKVSDQPAKPAEDESPIVASKRPGAHKITNKDFERYRARREEMARNVAAKEASKESNKETGKVSSPAASPVADEAKTEPDKGAELLAKRRELEKDKEEYWKGRARPLLTQIRVLEDQIAIVSAQIDENKRNPLNQNNNVQIYSTQPGGYYPPPVRIGGIPIWIGGGGGRTTGGGSTVIVQGQNPAQQRAMTLQERLTELQLQYQETLIQFEELREEGRKAGALPGWFR